MTSATAIYGHDLHDNVAEMATMPSFTVQEHELAFLDTPRSPGTRGPGHMATGAWARGKENPTFSSARALAFTQGNLAARPMHTSCRPDDFSK